MTIKRCLDSLTNSRWQKLRLTWPPDLFALVAYVLQESGAYLQVVETWPPGTGRFKNHTSWVAYIRRVGKKWRNSCVRNKLPTEVAKWWRQIKAANHLPISELRDEKNRNICEALLTICAAADEASAGIGISDPRDLFLQLADKIFRQRPHSDGAITTLCSRIDTTVVVVLPKLHTPKSGLTIRSLTHHLALCRSGEVKPRFIIIPGLVPEKKSRSTINLLLVPWPNEVSPSDFQPLRKGKPGLHAAKSSAHFQFKARGGQPWGKQRFATVLGECAKFVNQVDGIIFPELCFNGEEEVVEAWDLARQNYPGAFLFTGVAIKDGASTVNSAACIFPPFSAYALQAKHHAWSLTPPQLRQYGLCGHLAAEKLWWEDTKLEPRTLNFFRLSPWLTTCCLICEDLARQDPVAQLIRNIGPNLLIALLMDGPQLSSRWPARYASVFAEDPGCSVLTLTNLGMVRLSRAFGLPESRVIALWKDADSGAVQIDLPSDADAAILTLSLKTTTEYTADGRSDGACTGNWTLDGINYIRRKPLNA